MLFRLAQEKRKTQSDVCCGAPICGAVLSVPATDRDEGALCVSPLVQVTEAGLGRPQYRQGPQQQLGG